MSRVTIYGQDGSVQSSYDSADAPAGTASGTSGAITASSLTNSGDTSLNGALSVSGHVTVGNGLNITSGVMTFPDGTTQNTASTGGGTGSASAGSSTSGATGTIAASSITNSGDTTLTGKLNVTGASTLGALTAANFTCQGAASFSANISATGNVSSGGILSGASLVTTGNATVGGNVSAANFSLKSGGVFTFADGTTQATATLKGDTGPQGPKGDTGATGPAGPAGSTGTSSSAAQFTATAQGTATAPSFTQDVNSNTGMYVSGSGSTSAVNMTVNGANVGSWATSGLKLATGSVITFPDGSTQTSASNNSVQLNQTAAGFGPGAQFSGQTVGSTATPMNFNGTTVPYTFTPAQSSALTGLHVTNYSLTGATVYFYLVDLTAGATVYNYNSGNGIASGATASVSLGPTAYPLVAGHQYQWQAQRVASGVGYLQINPQYLTPSTTAVSSITYYPSGFISSSTATTTAASGGSITFQNPGIPGQTGYYRNASASYLYSLQLTASGSGTFSPYFYNETGAANGPAPLQTGVLTSTAQTFTFGPYSSTTFPFTLNTTNSFRLYGNGSALSVNPNAYAQIQVGQ